MEEFDIQFVDCETGEVLGHVAPFYPPSRASYVRLVEGDWHPVLVNEVPRPVVVRLWRRVGFKPELVA